MTSRKSASWIPVVFFFCGLGFAALYWGASRPKIPLQIPAENFAAQQMEGAPAISFALEDSRGEMVNLAQFKGKKILLNFWASWCPPCVDEIPSLVRFAKMNADVVILTVSVDEDRKKVKELFEKQKWGKLETQPFRILYDDKSVVSTRYGTSKLPESYFIDETFTVTRKFVGPQDWTSGEINQWVRKNTH